MFLSYKYNKYLGKNAAGKYFYEYTIVDSDFTVIDVAALPRSRSLSAVSAAIKVYGKRNLNVAANLVRLAQYLNKTYGWSFEHIFNSWKKYIPEYKKYEEEMQKYLVIL